MPTFRAGSGIMMQSSLCRPLLGAHRARLTVCVLDPGRACAGGRNAWVAVLHVEPRRRGVSAFPRPHVQPAAGCGLRQAPRTVRTTLPRRWADGRPDARVRETCPAATSGREAARHRHVHL
jgi:hypothetical protein